jgi:hypothetical protein
MTSSPQSVSGVSVNRVRLVGGYNSGIFIASGDLVGNFYYQRQNVVQARLRLDYTGQFAGDYDDVTLDFASGTFIGTQTYNGGNGPLSGTFTYVP